MNNCRDRRIPAVELTGRRKQLSPHAHLPAREIFKAESAGGAIYTSASIDGSSASMHDSHAGRIKLRTAMFSSLILRTTSQGF
jgi:hypothetical protein